MSNKKNQNISVKTAVAYDHARDGSEQSNARYHIQTHTHQSVDSLVRAHEALALKLQAAANSRNGYEEQLRIVERQLVDCREELKKAHELAEKTAQEATHFRDIASEFIKLLLKEKPKAQYVMRTVGSILPGLRFQKLDG